jgi:hypothetical protein
MLRRPTEFSITGGTTTPTGHPSNSPYSTFCPSKQDFALIETELMASGFEISEIKFQPNSAGRIIVSDSKKAALLEFSGGA